MDRSRSNRILLLSDGYSTDDIASVQDALLHRNVPLDVRMLSSARPGDWVVADLSVPSRVAAGDTFLLQAVVYGPGDADAPYTVSKNGAEVARGVLRLRDGRGVVQVSDVVERAGAYHYDVIVSPHDDPIPDNNQRGAWLEASGPGRILVLSGYTDDPVARSLSEMGWRVEVVQSPESLTAGTLTGTQAVIFDNIHASRVSPEFLKSLEFFVRSQGGGLLMIGGQNSFGSGGYYSSDLDPLLPVSMELRKEYRRLSVAMAIVLDRSGSMGASVAGNMGNMNKLDLACEGAAQTAELLSAEDALAVYAVDSETHVVVPLGPVGEQRSHLLRTIRSVDVGGGGIYVYTGLESAWRDLERSGIARKHIVLFSDAADSEEPGGYKQLLQTVTKNGGTVSVIGLGSRRDSDARLLQEIADLGKGRIFFVDNAVDLPAVFAQGTTSVARSLFVTEPAALLEAPEWHSMTTGSVRLPDSVDGYNLTYIRQGASTLALSKDEYGSPLVAAWQRGAGRAATVSFPLAGAYSGRVRSWNGYKDLVGTLVSWLAAPDLPPNVAVKTHVDGTTLSADLFFGDTWEDTVLSSPPLLSLAFTGGEQRDVTWDRMAPGHFRASFDMPPGAAVRGAIRVGKAALPFGPIGSQSSVEWQFDSRQPATVRELSRASGGRELVDLSAAWDLPPTASRVPLAYPLLVAAMIVFLLEALRSRLDARLSVPRLSAAMGLGSALWHSVKKTRLLVLARRRPKIKESASSTMQAGEREPPVAEPKEERVDSNFSKLLGKAKRRGKD
jgi:hypothetical protein